MTTGSFSDQLHDLWRTRPLRLPQQGHVAGVAAGIGQRYRVDPVLVRVAFVVSTIFGGAGIILYIASWLLLSKPGDQVSPAESLIGRGRSSQSGTRRGAGRRARDRPEHDRPIGFGMGVSVVLSFALMLGGLWLLYQRQPVPPELPASVAQAAPGYPVTTFQTAQANAYPPPAYSPYTRLPDHYEPESAPAGSSTDAATDAGTTSPTPPAWDPLGVAPFAWDLPNPPARPNRRPSFRADHAAATPRSVLGLAVLAAAAATAMWAVTGAEWLSPARIGAISLR